MDSSIMCKAGLVRGIQGTIVSGLILAKLQDAPPMFVALGVIGVSDIASLTHHHLHRVKIS